MSGCMHQLSQQSIVWASQSDDFILFHYLKNLDLIDCAWTALLSGYFLSGAQKREAWEHLMPSFSCGAHRQGAAGWPQIVVRVLDQRKACSAIGKEQTTAVEHTGLRSDQQSVWAHHRKCKYLNSWLLISIQGLHKFSFSGLKLTISIGGGGLNM